MILLRPPQVEDVDRLFPLVYQQDVTDTLLWDGPVSLEEYRQGISRRAERVKSGESHLFTLVEPNSENPVGMTDIRPYEGESYRADIGLWVGKPYQGKGYGTIAVRCLAEYGFAQLNLEKIEAFVFVGNQPSRRIFEKNGFALEGTIRKAVLKRGRYLDEWLLGITREDYGVNPYWIVHLCQMEAWQAALKRSSYYADSLKEEGFIHASLPEQITAVANTFYRGRQDQVLLWIDPARVQAEVRWEPVGEAVFPHIYGALNLEAVLTVTRFQPDPEGIFYGRPLPINH